MFDHIVKISAEEKRLYIYRIYHDGRQEFYTSVDLPMVSSEPENVAFQKFSQQLGENILVDSPVARKAFGI